MSGMTVYFARRLVLVPLTFLAITFLVYMILRVVPGGPIEQAQAQRRLKSGEGARSGGRMVGEETGLQLGEEGLRQLEEYYALDRSVPVGYLQWLGLWPRERRHLVPPVSETLHADALARLRERAAALAAAAERTATHLAGRDRTAHDGRLWKPAADGEVPADLRHDAELLIARTLGQRFALRKLLAAHRLGWADGAFLTPVAETPGDAALLAAEASATRELRATEEETGYALDEDGRPYAHAFAPLRALRRAETTADERLQSLLDDLGLVEHAGRLHRPLTDGEHASRADLLAETDALATQGFGKRDELLERLAEEGLTWRGGEYFVLAAAEDEAGKTEQFATARALIAARRAAADKLAEIREERGFEITDALRIYTVDSELSGILQLDFGRSYTYGEPVLSVIGSKMEVSIQFGLTGYILAWLVCVPLGVYKAIKHRSLFDTTSSALIFLGYAVPGFVVALVLLSTVAVHVDWLPLGGYKPPNIEELGWLDSVIGRIRHMIIPVIGYTIGSFATMTILMKNSLLENLGQDYVRTAFAKGLSERRVIFVHALRNSLIPITAGVGHALAILFAGSFLVEKTCNIDGMGLLGFRAILERDYPIMMGLLVFLVLIQLFGNILSDIVWALIDPRIRFGS